MGLPSCFLEQDGTALRFILWFTSPLEVSLVGLRQAREAPIGRADIGPTVRTQLPQRGQLDGTQSQSNTSAHLLAHGRNSVFQPTATGAMISNVGLTRTMT